MGCSQLGIIRKVSIFVMIYMHLSKLINFKSKIKERKSSKM